MIERSIIVHDLKDAMIAISVATRQGCGVTLRSPPGAATYLGPQVFLEMIERAKVGHKDTEVHAVFDCGDDAGLALSALRHGLKAIRINVPTRTLEKISDIATQMQARLETANPDDTEGVTTVLDLLDLEDAESAIRSWLMGRYERP